ncbi:MAG: NAD(P)H-binding protein, partial [Pirellulales bacterium]
MTTAASAVDRNWMLYGANGYTGRLIAEEAARRGWRPVLAGRRASEIEELARKCGSASRVFSVDRVEDVVGQLSGIAAVLNCAGPFSKTAPKLM